MTKFKEAFDAIHESTFTVDEKGNKKLKARTFKRDDFEKLLKAILNTPDYQVAAAKASNGEVTVEQIPAVQKVRKAIRKVLIDFGVDKAEADTILDKYEFTNVDGFYELISEAIYTYIETGKKFNFITKEDFQGSLLLDQVEAGVTEHRDMQSKDPDAKFKQSHKAHKVLVRKSKTPDWLKTRL